MRGRTSRRLDRESGQLGREVAVALQLCKSDETHIAGQWGCAAIMAGIVCLTTGGPIKGVIDGNELRMVSEPLPGGQVHRCDFTARPGAQALTLEGSYMCSASVRAEGAFIVSRCAQ